MKKNTNIPLAPTTREEFEIAIVCSKALEYNAICHLFDDFWDEEGDVLGRAIGDHNTYTIGRMGKFNVVVVLLCNSGKGIAAGTASSLRSSYPSIQLAFLIGICHGVPNSNPLGKEILLGDVVISDTIIQYDLGTPYPNISLERHTLEERFGRSNKNIRNFITNINTNRGYELLEEKAAFHLEQIQKDASKAKSQRRQHTATYKYPGASNDILFKSSYCHRHYNSLQCVCANYDGAEDPICEESRALDCEQTGCENAYLEPRKRLEQKKALEINSDVKAAQQPSIFIGRFGSGDTIFGSGIYRDYFAHKHQIMAFEMEGAGVWDELPCIIVKGVSDYGDCHKTKNWKEWQNFAAATAASVARGLIERYPKTDKSLAAEFANHENTACLKDLFITNPEHDKIRIEDTKGGLLPAAYDWILGNEGFTQWRKNPGFHLLWVKGDPGKGKTMLLCGIINTLQETSSKVYYFLCQATDIRLNNTTAILRGLLYMVISQQPLLISYIKEEYNKLGKAMFEGPNAYIVLSRIFFNILEDPFIRGSIFIIDALDECLIDLSQLLSLVKRSSSSSLVKWLVSSRNEAAIQEMLASAENKSTISLELNAKSVSAAITTYIHYKVQLLCRLKSYNQHIADSIEKYLSDNASGTFLWVALVCELLEKAPQSDPLPKAAKFPPGLNQLYNRMIERVYSSDISGLSKKVLSIATVTRRPLTTQEFIPLISLYKDNNDNGKPLEYIWEDIISYCGSFLAMKNNTIYFIHQSAKDYLDKQQVYRLFPNGKEYIHRSIFKTSINIMRDILKRDLYNLVKPGISIENLPEHISRNNAIGPIEYFCVYWIDHLEYSTPQDTKEDVSYLEIHELIYTFLQGKYIYWLEALSLFRSVFEGVAGMQKLKQLVANTKISGLKELVWDACRFIQMFSKVIADFPLQVYISALLFSPSQSIIRQLFQEEGSPWIQTWPDGKEGWTRSLRKLEGSTIGENHELHGSSCGKWLASSYLHGTINIWEIKTGRIIRTLERCPNKAGNQIISLCFSPRNSKELALSWPGYDNIITWDVTTGEIGRQFSLGKHINSMKYLTSAPDLLGCLSKDYGSEVTVASIWNTKTGQMIKSIQLRDIAQMELGTFSPSGNSIILQQESKTENQVAMISVDTGNPIRTFRYGGNIKSIKLSPDGTLLAVLAEDKSRPSTPNYTVTLSDTTSGEVKWMFRCASKQSIPILAFSADGELIAIAAAGELQIIDATSGQGLQKSIMQSSCLAFSLDKKEIFSGHFSTIDVLEVDLQEMPSSNLSHYAPEQEIRQRYRPSISPNGIYIASYLREFSVIEVMDTYSKLPAYILKVDSFLKSNIIFSPNSKKLAFMSSTRLFLWDISSKTGRVIFTLKLWLPLFQKEKIIFSSDGQLLAISLCYIRVHHNLCKVDVWDTNSGDCLMRVEKEAHVVDILLSFSPDNKRLAISRLYIGAKNIRVEIWDIASNTGIRAIDLDHTRFNRYLDVPNLLSDSFYTSDQGIEFTFDKLLFLGQGRLILDLHWDRLAIEPANDMDRFKEEESYSIDPSYSWITFNGENLAWIPPEYRCSPSDDRIIQRNNIALPHFGMPHSIIKFRCGTHPRQTTTPSTSTNEYVCSSSEKEAYTYMRELKDWILEHLDMGPPDDEMMRPIDIDNSTIGEIKERFTSARWNTSSKFASLKYMFKYK
ncbi:hypothetical protein V8C37DRAFT_417037 [Trichoderma ceciliae]